MPDTPTKTLLLVEDEAIIALSEMRQLQSEGYQVVHALTGENALRLICDSRITVDLILMDIDLGSGMDGIETARRILNYRDIPVLFVSSHTEQEIVQRTEEITSYGYVVKNSSPTVLFASIKMAFKLYAAHTRLKESEERYRRLVEGAPDIFYTFSSKHGGIYYSPHASHVLGYSLDHLYANPFLWNESIHPNDREEIGAIIQAFEVGLSFDIQYRIRHADGHWIWLRDRSIGRQVRGDEVLIEGLATDITASKQIENTLRDSEKHYRELFENTPMAIFQSSIDGKVLAVNPAFSTLFGYTSSDEFKALVKNAADVFADPNRRLEILRLRAQKPHLREFINLYRRKDGTVFYGRLNVRDVQDAQGNPVAIEGFIDHIYEKDQRNVNLPLQQFIEMASNGLMNPDLAPFEKLVNERTRILRGVINQLEMEIQERKQIETRLRQSEESFRTLFEGAPDAIFLADPQTGVILDANHAAARLVGKPREQIRGLLQSELHPPQEIAVSQETFQRHIAESQSQGFTNPIENELLRADHTLLPVEVVAQVITIQNRPVIMGTFRDISQRRLVEARLRESEKQARTLFENSPIGLWEEDFSNVRARFNQLASQGVIDLQEYLSAHPDEVNQLASLVKVVSANQAVVNLLKAKELRDLNGNLTSALTADMLALFSEQICALAEGDLHFASEFQMRDMQGQPIVIGQTLTVMPGCEETWSRVLVSLVDLTERKAAENKIKVLLHEKELLLKEVHHRVKNNMSSIFSLLSMQMEVQKDPGSLSALQDAAGRVQSMMTLYDKLYQSPNFDRISLKRYLPALLSEVKSIFPGSCIVDIQTEIDDIALPPKLVSPLGIILNEMITNSMKYAFIDRDHGTISLKTSVHGKQVRVVYCDDGIGLPERTNLENSSGFGLQLIKLLVKQIDGEITIHRQNGVLFQIDFNMQ